MQEFLFYLDDVIETKGTSLQARVHAMLTRAILSGKIPLTTPLPSSRRLAEQLRVSRSTVVLVYEQLTAEGFLVARPRSGYFINPSILELDAAAPPPADPDGAAAGVDWPRRLSHRFSTQTTIRKPANWRSYPYPFITGQIDQDLFPIAEWRECSRAVLNADSVGAWMADHLDADDPELVEQIRTRLLPRRGVWAAPEEILVTLGTQHSLYLTALLLGGADACLAMEDPGYVDARNIFQRHFGWVKHVPVDESGLQPGPQLAGSQVLYVTPSHQAPTTVTLPLERRQTLLAWAREADAILIEDDYEPETNYLGRPTPALKSLDRDGRVIYAGSLSKSLAPGLRLGYLVAPAPVIAEARALRRLMLRHPPTNNQRVCALFLARGYHESLLLRVRKRCARRWGLLQASLTRHLPSFRFQPLQGGSSCWLEAPGLNVDAFAARADAAGILIEPGAVFFADPQRGRHTLRLGFGAIADERIEPGIAALAKLL